jgi:RNA polymerase sigma factor (sigma-70 family)
MENHGGLPLMPQTQLIPHLFRTEFRKITAVLCKHFGVEHIQIAEDIASETFLSALETWPYNGIPENPVAWLYTVAKNKVKNHIHRRQIFIEKVAPKLTPDEPAIPEVDLSEKNISDSQLQMLFAICHPTISAEAQIGLALRILCGFGIEEIANAFLTNKETINKRLFRAKEKLRLESVQVEFPSPAEINQRLETVLTTLYLLFNEGYYSESRDGILREDLCLEAMRLMYLLVENSLSNTPPVNALLALMCFHASRFAARKNKKGEMILYDQQDEKLWNYDLIEKGIYYLHQASLAKDVSTYHLEAAIAYCHTQKADTAEKWSNILQLYNQLLIKRYSPVAALNRTFALAKLEGKEIAIAEAEKLNLSSNHFYYTLLGELYLGIDNKIARQHLEKAFALAKTETDKQTIAKKLLDIPDF